jgi:hypothetical protein
MFNVFECTTNLRLIEYLPRHCRPCTSSTLSCGSGSTYSRTITSKIKKNHGGQCFGASKRNPASIAAGSRVQILARSDSNDLPVCHRMNAVDVLAGPVADKLVEDSKFKTKCLDSVARTFEMNQVCDFFVFILNLRIIVRLASPKNCVMVWPGPEQRPQIQSPRICYLHIFMGLKSQPRSNSPSQATSRVSSTRR